MDRIATVMLLFSFFGAGAAYAQTDKQVEARLTPIVHACEKSSANGGTLQQALCYKDEATRQDEKLNKAWIRVIGLASQNQRVRLRQSERQWIKDRNEDCHNEATAYVSSTAAYMFNVCMANETIRRTMWLEQVR